MNAKYILTHTNPSQIINYEETTNNLGQKKLYLSEAQNILKEVLTQQKQQLTLRQLVTCCQFTLYIRVFGICGVKGDREVAGLIQHVSMIGLIG